ncbi:zinc finger BED domain-containing protein RICESLEEPER 2, partial [Tanacetum coccineum]
MASESASASTATGVGSTSASTIPKKAQQNQNPKARQTSMARDGRVFSEYERYVNSDFVTHLHPKEFATFDVLGFWKEKETMFLVLSRMAMDIISVQASSIASKSAFSTSGRRKQDKSTLETHVDFKEEILDAKVQVNEAIPLSNEEIALDAANSE